MSILKFLSMMPEASPDVKERKRKKIVGLSLFARGFHESSGRISRSTAAAAIECAWNTCCGTDDGTIPGMLVVDVKSDSGGDLAIAASSDGRLSLLDLQSSAREGALKETLRISEIGTKCTSVAWRPEDGGNESHVLCGFSSIHPRPAAAVFDLLQCDTVSPDPISTLSAEHGGCLDVTFLDRDLPICSFRDGTAILWDIRTKKPATTIQTSCPEMWSVCTFPRDHRFIACASAFGLITSWDIRNASLPSTSTNVLSPHSSRLRREGGTMRNMFSNGILYGISLCPFIPTKAAFLMSKDGTGRTAGIVDLSTGVTACSVNDSGLEDGSVDSSIGRGRVEFLCDQPCHSSALIVCGTRSGIRLLQLPMDCPSQKSGERSLPRVIKDVEIEGPCNSFALHPREPDFAVCSRSSGGLSVVVPG